MRHGLIVYLTALLLTLLIGTSAEPEDKALWPKVQTTKKTICLANRKKESARLLIRSENGKPLYLLECRINAYDHQDPNFDYSGDFECRLTSLYSKESISTLLTEEEHPTRDWQSRGRFLLEELAGKCADYPEYGKVRHFRLRGMELTIAVEAYTTEEGSAAKNGPWHRDRIEKMRFTIKVTPCATALSPIAEPVRYAAPPRAHPEDPNNLSLDCEKVFFK
jgi:hypothetical protein